MQNSTEECHHARVIETLIEPSERIENIDNVCRTSLFIDFYFKVG